MKVTKTPSKDEFLTIHDLPSLPNGEDTLARIAVDAQYTEIHLARIGDSGLLKTFEDTYFQTDSSEIIEVVNDDA